MEADEVQGHPSKSEVNTGYLRSCLKNTSNEVRAGAIA